MNYYCKNGAYHIYKCCDTCWNLHPKAEKNKMFFGSETFNKVLDQNFIQKAKQVGFTEQQIEFLSQIISTRLSVVME